MKNVSLEVAKLARDKGFDEKCLHYYVVDFMNFKATGIPKQHLTPVEDNPNILQLCKVGKRQLHLRSAPFQSQLQTWLRDKHNIDILSKIFSIKGQKMYAFDVTIFGTGIYNKCEKKDNFEDALDIALLEALQLIENDDLAI